MSRSREQPRGGRIEWVKQAAAHLILISRAGLVVYAPLFEAIDRIVEGIDRSTAHFLGAKMRIRRTAHDFVAPWAVDNSGLCQADYQTTAQTLRALEVSSWPFELLASS